MEKELLINYGYKEEELELISKSYALSRYKAKSLYAKINEIYLFFLKLGYTNKEIIELTIGTPEICGLSVNNINQKI